MAWPDWDPNQETYVDYLIRTQSVSEPFQTQTGPPDAPEAPQPPPTSPDVYVPPAVDVPSAPRTAPSSDPFGDYLRNNPGKKDAWAYVEALLADYGLGELTDFTKDSIVQGFSQNEVVQRLRETDPYKKRFAVIEQLKQQGLPPVSESEVIAYEKEGTQLMRSAGLPSGFWDQPEDFVKLMVSGVSLTELDHRVNQGYVEAAQAPQDVRDEWKNLYGLSEGALAAYFIDPDRTEAVLTKQIGAAQRAAEAQRTGFGSLSRSEAENLQSLGVTGSQATQGFGQLTQQRELMNGLPGENVDSITRQEQLDAAFSGNAFAQQRIERRAKERVAQFAGGGTFTNDRQGFGGVGTAR